MRAISMNLEQYKRQRSQIKKALSGVNVAAPSTQSDLDHLMSQAVLQKRHVA